jgi:hypothetical protein
MSAWDEFLHNPIEVTGALVTVLGGAASWVWRPLRRFWSNLWAHVRSKPVILSETVRIVQNVNSSFWSEAKRGEQRLMQIRFDGHITDISGQPNRILRAEIPKPLPRCFVFHRCGLVAVGALTAALEKAKRDLPLNETRVFGLSNVLMLLNGLLKYRFPDFTNAMLDEVERLTDGLGEHPFLIPAKLAAIRASRLQTRTL